MQKSSLYHDHSRRPHFVQYHNPDKMGGPYRRGTGSFRVVTNKAFDGIAGSYIWLVTGIGKPRRYFICQAFIADEVVAHSDPPFGFRVSGKIGSDYEVEIGHLNWFPELRRIMGNFAFGFQSITDQRIISGLMQAVTNT